MDRWQTAIIPFSGGLLENVPQITQGIQFPGSLIDSLNFEPHQAGGYRRISGYTKFDPNVLPGSGTVLGVFVFKMGVIGCRQNDVYVSGGSGWTQINGVVRTAAKKYRAARYNWVSDCIILVDQVNKPGKWDGTTWTELVDAPLACVDVCQFKNYLFLAHEQILTFSAPLDETDYDTVNGAGEINVGFTIEGVFPWRDQLYIFGKDKISKLTGSIFGDVAGNDAKLDPVSQGIGCLSRFTIQEAAGDVLFLAADGIRTIAGTSDIGDVNLAAYSKSVYKSFNNFIDKYFQQDISSVLIKSKTQYRIFGGYSGETPIQAIGYILVVKEDRKSEFGAIQGIQAACADSTYIAQKEYIIHGGYDGYVYRQESGASFDSTPIPFNLQLPYNPIQDPEIRKILYKHDLYIESEGSTLSFTLAYSFDYGDIFVQQPLPIVYLNPFTAFASPYDDPESEYDDTPPDVYAVERFRTLSNNLIGSCFNVSFIISGTAFTNPFIVKSLNIQFDLGDRR